MSIVPAKLHHVSRQTLKLEETRRFYTDVLGFKEISRPTLPFPGAWLYGAGIQIHLIQEPFDAPPEAVNTRENHIAFLVSDLDAAENVLKQNNVSYHRQTVPGRPTAQMFFRDPDGWLIELGTYPAVMDQ